MTRPGEARGRCERHRGHAALQRMEWGNLRRTRRAGAHAPVDPNTKIAAGPAAQPGSVGAGGRPLAVAPADAVDERVTARLDQRVATVIAGLAMTASGALVATAGQLVTAVSQEPRRLVTLLGLTLVLQMCSVRVYGRGSVSVSAIGILIAVYVLPGGAAMAIACVAAFAQWLRKRPEAYKGVFDMGNYVTSTAAAALVFHATADYRLAAALLAGLAYAVVNNGMLCLVWSLAEGMSVRTLWLERFHWARFHFALFGALAYAGTIAYEQIGILGLAAFVSPSALMMLSVRQYLEKTAAAVEDTKRAHDRLRLAHRDTIAALSRTIEAKDFYTGGHTERVAQIAIQLGRRLGYAGEPLEAIEIGALLHDVGKIGVPEAILRKAGPLTDEEWAIMRTHPIISDRILADLDLDPIVRQCARSSHERIDGTGYPDGLPGDQIPLPARIVFVADAYDALTTDRPYRRAMSPVAALEEIEHHAGTQFCPSVVAALLAVWAAQPETLLTPSTPPSITPLRAIETIGSRADSSASNG